MSFGWSVGDLVTAATLAWNVYESFGTGIRSASHEFSSFQAEFTLVKVTLDRLQDIAGSESEKVKDSLGPYYQQTLNLCGEFLTEHKDIAEDAERRPSLWGDASRLWGRASWPTHRKRAEQLRKALDRYVHIAILKVTANTSDATRQLLRESHQARAEHLQMLKAIKTLSIQVSSMLKRCVPDGLTEGAAVDAHNFAGPQHRQLGTFLPPWPGLNAIPENDVLSQSETLVSDTSQEAVDRMEEMQDRLSQFMRRLDTLKRHNLGSTPNAPDSDNLEAATVAPLLELLHKISDEIVKGLREFGYGSVSVPNQASAGKYHATSESSKVLNNATEEWERFHEWLQFQLVHALNPNPGDPGLVSGPSRRTSFESALSLSPHATPSTSPDIAPNTSLDAVHRASLNTISRASVDASSRAYSTSPPQVTLSPRVSPNVPASASPMMRTRSSDSYYGSRTASSAGSMYDRRASLQPPVPLTKNPVLVHFPDSRHANSMTFHVRVYFDPHSNEPQRIEGDADNGLRLTHSVAFEHPPRSVETSLTPYISHSSYSKNYGTPYCIRFMGAHRVTLERNGMAEDLSSPPVYVCHNREDFYTFQKVLLGREVIFCANVKRIHTNNIEDQCALTTIRVLKDGTTRATSILYFASNRGKRLPSGFLTWLVSDFENPQKASNNDVKLYLSKKVIARRNSMGSANTTFSHGSRTSSSSWAETAQKIVSIQFDFEKAPDSDAFVKALQAP